MEKGCIFGVTNNNKVNNNYAINSFRKQNQS